jgi:hypothetical protein
VIEAPFRFSGACRHLASFVRNGWAIRSDRGRFV